MIMDQFTARAVEMAPTVDKAAITSIKRAAHAKSESHIPGRKQVPTE